MQNVKDKDILLLGDGAISNRNMDRIVTRSFLSATVPDSTEVLNHEITNNLAT